MTADGSTYAWPQSDVYVAKTSMEDYLSLDSPFHVYYMTISGHMPYNFNRVASKYRDLVEPLPYSETTKAYLATAIEADRMLQTLLDGLEQAGELDNTLIVACADHIPYFNVDTLEELSGQSFGSSGDMERLDEEGASTSTSTAAPWSCGPPGWRSRWWWTSPADRWTSCPPSPTCWAWNMTPGCWPGRICCPTRRGW